MSSETKSRQPPWHKPQPAVEEPVLKVYNSLTRSKDVFVPMNGKRVDWYNCGPTVYDAAHMGHARNYLTQDLIRRILRDYFGYEINFVMNVTDIDDKVRLERPRKSCLKLTRHRRSFCGPARRIFSKSTPKPTASWMRSCAQMCRPHGPPTFARRC